MSMTRRTMFPIIILAICGIVTIADYYLTLPTVISEGVSMLKNIAVLIASLALGLGLISILRASYGRYNRRDPGWQYSVWTIIVMIIFLAIGLIGGTNSETYQWLFNNIYAQINNTLYSLLGFYIVYACYRTFFARTWEVAVMLFFALLTMIGRAPIGEALWVGFGQIYEWIYTEIAVGGIAGFYITVAIGTAIIAVKILMGRERASLG
jgi:hypothetical protein